MAGDPSPTVGVADRVREARMTRGWSQTELATMAGVSRPTVARIEGGQHVLMGTLERVAKVLELDVALLPPKVLRTASTG